MQLRYEGHVEQSMPTAETKPDAGGPSETKVCPVHSVECNDPHISALPDAGKWPTPAMIAAARLAERQSLQPTAPSASSVDAATMRAAASRAAVSAAEQPAPLHRRRKKSTQSQLVAARILAERAAEDAARLAAAERAQEAAQLASESAKEARLAKEKERESIQQSVREAANGVVDAKEMLKRKSLEADRARLVRRRAADQLKVSKGDRDESFLDEACKEAARIEREEQRALDEVNAAQARLTDLRDQLNRFSMR